MRIRCMRYRLYVSILIAIISILGTSKSYAWKADLHVWIAQNIVNDISNGSLEFALGRTEIEFPTTTRYLRAVRKNPDSFLLGSIGPDAFPDAYTGQSVIHTSVPGGWGTSEWLQHLMKNAVTESDLAFVLGYHVHAATDVFAHTFANRYAGDVFDPDENEWASVRHIYLESFVSSYLPPLISSQGEPMGSAAETLRPEDEVEIPEQLILNSLLLNADANEQYKLSGRAPHLVAANDLYALLEEFLSDGGALSELESQNKEALSAFYVDQKLIERQVSELRQLRTRTDVSLNDGSEATSVVFQDVINSQDAFKAIGIDLERQGLKSAFEIHSEITTIDNEITQIERDILEASVVRQSIEKNLIEEVFREDCSYSLYTRECETKLVTVKTWVNPEWEVQNKLIQAMIRSDAMLRNKKTDLEQVLRVEIERGFDVLEDEHEQKRLINSQVIAVLESEPFGPADRQLLSQWRDNIPIALTEFSRASADTIVNTIDPDKPDVTEPMKKWFQCYGGAFTEVAANSSEADCLAWNSMDAVQEKVTQLVSVLSKSSPIYEEASDSKQRIIEQASALREAFENDAISAGLQEFEKIANSESVAAYKDVTDEVDLESVNDKFSRDPTDSDLPIVDQAGQRLISEMNLRNGRQLDPANFYAVNNSIVLSKLALLDKSDLNNLSKAVELTNTLFGDDLYSGTTADSENILYGFLRNTNGNHQWHDLAPPQPRETIAAYDTDEFNLRASSPDNRFGYADHGCSRSKGMRLWVDPVARELLFKRLFKGKITAGIDSPDELGPDYEAVLDGAYPDLFSGDSWSSDALNYYYQRGESFTELLISGIGDPGFSVEFFIGGSHLASDSYDVNGKFELKLEVPDDLLPSQLVAVVKDADLLKTFHRFSVGCDELAYEYTVDRLSNVEILPGDTLWNISSRLTSLGKNYWRLYKANKDAIGDPYEISENQRLVLPWHSEVSVTLPKQ